MPAKPYLANFAEPKGRTHMAAPYPYRKVILGYTLLGGALGGLFVALFFGSPEFVFGGIYFGTAPALLLGLWLAWRRVQRNGYGLCQAVLVGALFSVLEWIILILLLDRSFDFLFDGMTQFVFMVTAAAGAASGGLLAWLLLPKPETDATPPSPPDRLFPPSS